MEADKRQAEEIQKELKDKKDIYNMAAQRYYYSDTITDFLARGTNEIVGTLSQATPTPCISYPRRRQGLSKGFASPSKLFELANALSKVWERRNKN